MVYYYDIQRKAVRLATSELEKKIAEEQHNQSSGYNASALSKITIYSNTEYTQQVRIYILNERNNSIIYDFEQALRDLTLEDLKSLSLIKETLIKIRICNALEAKINESQKKYKEIKTQFNKCLEGIERDLKTTERFNQDFSWIQRALNLNETYRFDDELFFGAVELDKTEALGGTLIKH